MASESSEPFLMGYSSDEESEGKYASQRRSHGSTRWLTTRNLVIHGVLISLYTMAAVLFVNTHTAQECNSSQHTTSHSLNVAFEDQEVVFHNLSQTPYAGEKPEEDLEKAWKDLMKPMNMRFTEEELDSVNQESVALPENGGYMGWFGVFHELHCVKLLRHAFDRARECNSTEEESKKDKGHVDHCIELLRQSAVCHPDTSLTTFRWDPTNKLPMFNVSETVHTCVNWDAFMESNKYRVIEEAEVDRLKNPIFKGN